MPTFKLGGQPLVSYGAATAHCAFYVMSTGVLRAHAAVLKGYELGNGSMMLAKRTGSEVIADPRR